MKKMTAAEKKAITQDWKVAIGAYEIYKPLHLLKRNGPLLTGIYLKPVYGGEHYVPVFHTHSLMTPFPVVSLAMPSPLLNDKGVDESISPLRHSTRFDELVERFRLQCPMAFLDTLSCATLDTLYQNAVASAHNFPIQAMTDNILLLAWCKKEASVAERIESYKRILQGWPESVTQHVEGATGWERELKTLLDPQRLVESVTQELKKFKLSHFPDHSLACD
jgi:hypothetical protein